MNDKPAPGNLCDVGASSLVRVTSRCNNRCLFCPDEASGNRHSALDRGFSCNDAVLSKLEALRASSAKKVVFCGGEPTMAEKLPRWIAAARRMGFESVALRTNGRRLAYRRYMKRLLQAGLDTLEISLHGSRPEIHDHHTRADGSFRQTLTGLRLAASLEISVGVTSMVTRSNYRHMGELARLLSGSGVERIVFVLAIPEDSSSAARLPSLVPRLALVAPHAHSASTIGKQYGILVAVNGLPPCLQATTIPGVTTGESFSGVHGLQCRTCTVSEECSGVHPLYAEHYGLSELQYAARMLHSPSREEDQPVPRFAGSVRDRP